jgi:hypothetical protein
MVRRRILSRPALSLATVVVLALAITGIAAVAAVPTNLSKAIEAQRRQTSERPQDPGAFNDLGNLLVLAHQTDDAEASYRKALELDPKKVTALFNLGLLLQQRGGADNVREAMGLFEKAVEIQPDHAWAHYQIGAIHELRGEDSKAIREYAQAFALDPQLAFKEVNPHIVESKLVTQSMLLAYRAGQGLPQAPTTYDDPNRIANLLVPKAQTQREAVAAKPDQPAAVQGAAGPTVLRPGDLRPGATGQAMQGRPGSRTATGGTRTLRQWERPEPSMDNEGNNPATGMGRPGPVLTPPAGGVYYRPGAPSSGRLDLKLVPGRQADRDARG